jgi:hypothetical protein
MPLASEPFSRDLVGIKAFEVIGQGWRMFIPPDHSAYL